MGVTPLGPMEAKGGQGRRPCSREGARGDDRQTDGRSVHHSKEAITSKIKHAIKLKTRPARLAQLLLPSLAFVLAYSQ